MLCRPRDSPVPRFFFHVEDGPDDLGMELPSVADAKCEAARYAGKLLSDAAATFWTSGEIAMTVTNDAGLALFILNISGIDSPSILVVPKVSA